MGTMGQGFEGKGAWGRQGPQTRESPEMVKEVQLDIELVGGVGLLRSALEGKADIVARGDNTAVWTMGRPKVSIVFDPATKRISKLSYPGKGLAGPAHL